MRDQRPDTRDRSVCVWEEANEKEETRAAEEHAMNGGGGEGGGGGAAAAVRAKRCRASERGMDGWTDGGTQRETETERQRQRVRESERQRDRETESKRVRETERQRDRESEIQRDRQRAREHLQASCSSPSYVCPDWGAEQTPLLGVERKSNGDSGTVSSSAM